MMSISMVNLDYNFIPNLKLLHPIGQYKRIRPLEVLQCQHLGASKKKKKKKKKNPCSLNKILYRKSFRKKLYVYLLQNREFLQAV